MDLLLDKIAKLERRIDHLERLEPHVIACRVYNDADITHSSTGNWQALTFNSERWDATGMHSTSTNTSRITFAAAGWYYVWGSILWTANSTGIRRVRILVGGSTAIAEHRITAPNASTNDAVMVSAIYYFSASQYVELDTWQNSGGNLAIIYGAQWSPEFAAIRLP